MPSQQQQRMVLNRNISKKDKRCTTKLCIFVTIGASIVFLMLFIYQTMSKSILKFETTNDNNTAMTTALPATNNKIKDTTTTTTTVVPFDGFRDNLLKLNPEAVWQDLLTEASQFLEQNPSLSSAQLGVAMEVGMHRAVSCIQAAKAGLEAHCVEPSPKSFIRVKNGVNANSGSEEVKSRIHLYQKAASDTSGIMVPFSGSGGTGDFVGEGGYDIWTMTKKEVSQGSVTDKSLTTVQVESVALDDIIENNVPSSHVYIIKIDVQGFEPNVLKGLQRSLSEHKITFLLMEYWPKGIEFMHDEPLGSCTLAVEMLQTSLVNNGYKLYASSVVAHPRAPKGSKQSTYRPLDNLLDNCLWYHQNEITYKSEEYKMGYWSDILAVAPNAKLPSSTPTTSVGRALKLDLQ